MKTKLGKLRFVFYGLIAMELLSLMMPLSLRRTTGYLDICNGRMKVKQRLFGILRSEEVTDTDFSELVTKYHLQGHAEWVRTFETGSDLSGFFGFSALNHGALLANRFSKFATDYWPASNMDDPTTVIVQMRKLARNGDSEGMDNLLHSLLPVEDSISD